MIFEYTNYRDYLRANLLERITKNPSYSLRAMARQISVSPSTLSEVIKGKRNLSFERASELASRLALNEKEAEYFCLLVHQEYARDPEIKESIERRLESLNPQKKVRELSLDVFKLVADWYHFAILHLTELKDFNFSIANISKYLNISALEVETAIQRLERLEFIEKDAKGKYRKVIDAFVKSELPSEGLRRFHKQMLEKAIKSLTTQTPKEKFVGSETLAIDASRLGEANIIIEEFFNKMTEFFRKDRKKTDIYHLNVQFFNLRSKK